MELPADFLSLGRGSVTKRDESTWTQGGSSKKSKKGGKPPWAGGKTGQRQQSSQCSVKPPIGTFRPQDSNAVSVGGFT